MNRAGIKRECSVVFVECCFGGKFTIWKIFRLPEWVKPVIEPGGDFEEIALENYKTYTLTPELARLSTGFLIREILNHCSQKMKGTLKPDRSMWLYAAHDKTLASLLHSLGRYHVIFCQKISKNHFDSFKI